MKKIKEFIKLYSVKLIKFKDNRSNYDVQKWHDDRMKTETYLKNLCEFKPFKKLGSTF